MRVARVLGRTAAAVLLAVGLFWSVGAAPAAAFSDVHSGDWFSKAVDQLSTAGVVNGFSDGTFHPYDTVTRAQFASMLARAVKPPEATSEPFDDVYSTDWFWGSVASLYQAGLVSGTSPTAFSPQTGLARQQAATLVVRAVGYQQGKETTPTVDLNLTSEQTQGWLGAFRDRWFVTNVHQAGVANAYRLNIIGGYSDDRFYPFFTITRAQAAGMIYQALFVTLQPKTDFPQAVPGESSYPVQSEGSSGPLVAWMERRLADLRYVPGTIDSKYDHSTADAVMAFQKVEGLSRDGQAGEQFWSHIFGAHTPSPRVSAGGSRVEVDLSRQVLLLVNGGQVWKILPVSTGRSGLATPTGRYSIDRKINAWRQSALGLLYKPSYFNGGIAIHGAYSVPGYPASHGCVRVPYWATDGLYPQLPIGMRVDVYY